MYMRLLNPPFELVCQLHGYFMLVQRLVFFALFGLLLPYPEWPGYTFTLDTTVAKKSTW